MRGGSVPAGFSALRAGDGLDHTGVVDENLPLCSLVGIRLAIERDDTSGDNEGHTRLLI
jgi:hypothetical protein